MEVGVARRGGAGRAEVRCGAVARQCGVAAQSVFVAECVCGLSCVLCVCVCSVAVVCAVWVGGALMDNNVVVHTVYRVQPASEREKNEKSSEKLSRYRFIYTRTTVQSITHVLVI